MGNLVMVTIMEQAGGINQAMNCNVWEFSLLKSQPFWRISGSKRTRHRGMTSKPLLLVHLKNVEKYNFKGFTFIKEKE